ncbi:LOW QUALITY PROTEIN: transcription termination factor 3, mitochondrial-like [Pollicipes pollicipes]|uniref:LOW QUALITY PROTEIN: transcription termination factor 3, mitochondrial-like n=1 Tax=Pollicipes pollicipes TaxID=41117 RepID=UPI0018857FF3|nr:LOW QUALITY PROTEIN: transcription termination factor 3, mitochondrial-like [Pollicipes pollicipes]
MFLVTVVNHLTRHLVPMTKVHDPVYPASCEAEPTSAVADPRSDPASSITSTSSLDIGAANSPPGTALLDPDVADADLPMVDARADVTPAPTAAEPLPNRSHNLAPLVLASADLRRLVALGVDVSGWDRRPGIAQFVVGLDFERQVWPCVRWLHGAGVPDDQLGPFISRNPLIFKERLDDLQVRVNYLEAKRFSRQQVASVITRDPFWLLFSTSRIDRRLGFFAQLFRLEASEVRQLAAKSPGVITSRLRDIKDMRFTIKEEFGFSSAEMRLILLGKPKVWTLARSTVQERLQFLHNVMGLPHRLIAESPNVLTFRQWRVRQRHLMLNMLGRDQYDRSRPGFVSLDSLVGSTDEQFCRDVAKVPVATYNEFLKTL